eukprot:EG_transcript_25525
MPALGDGAQRGFNNTMGGEGCHCTKPLETGKQASGNHIHPVVDIAPFWGWESGPSPAPCFPKPGCLPRQIGNGISPRSQSRKKGTTGTKRAKCPNDVQDTEALLSSDGRFQ